MLPYKLPTLVASTLKFRKGLGQASPGISGSIPVEGVNIRVYYFLPVISCTLYLPNFGVSHELDPYADTTIKA
jgi:hypothetical protein